jgi:capsule polysaccharide modification protein KpsS
MDSKCYDEDVVYESHIEELILFCESTYFQKHIKDFRTSRALLFDNASAEYTLDQTEAFNEFGELLESLIEKFAEERSLDARVIYTECRDISEGAFTALFEEHEHKYVTNFSSSYLLLLRLIPADGLSICYWNGQILNNLQAL